MDYGDRFEDGRYDEYLIALDVQKRFKHKDNKNNGKEGNTNDEPNNDNAYFSNNHRGKFINRGGRYRYSYNNNDDKVNGENKRVEQYDNNRYKHNDNYRRGGYYYRRKENDGEFSKNENSFSSDKNNDGYKNNVCYQYQNTGSCKFGDNCRCKHVKQTRATPKAFYNEEDEIMIEDMVVNYMMIMLMR